MKQHGPLPEMGPPYDCDYCAIEFSEFKTFIDHRQLHLDRPEFQCLECNRVLAKRDILKRHMTIHVRAMIMTIGNMRIKNYSIFILYSLNAVKRNVTIVRCMR